MSYSVFISLILSVLSLFVSDLCHADSSSEAKSYEILTVNDGDVKQVDARLEELAWIQGSWQWHTNFGTPVQGDVVVGKPVHGQMLGHARGWDDNNIWFNEILAYTQRGSKVEFRVKHFSYDLHGSEPVDQPKIHPLIKRESNVFYFDRHTIVKEDDDHYTLYLLLYDEKGQPQRYVIPHRRLDSEQKR